VYRVSKGTRAYKEIMQVGLECQGDIDSYTITEVLLLATKSLEKISSDFVLDISHLGVISAVTDMLSLSSEGVKKVLTCLGEKNAEGILQVCKNQNANSVGTEILTALTGLYGKPQLVIEKLKNMPLPEKAVKAVEELENIVDELNALGAGDNINIDFSVVNDMGYYNGIVFKGFILGIPTGVLSGGQYDLLMEKMGSSKGAIGFAVYLDSLGKLNEIKDEYDVNTVILYSNKTALSAINKAVIQAKDLNESVLATTILPEKLRYKKLVDLKGDM
jgi:ATP phosphoribosyltransferase regulatory subunit